MATDTIYEKGDSLEALAIKARQWFINNNVEVPNGAAKWQKCSVRKGEIPPGTGITSLRRYGFNVTTFIGAITNDSSKQASNYSPLTPEKLLDIGFTFISQVWKNKHKYLLVKCNNCYREEELTYGKLQINRYNNIKYCRYCRNVGGKEKSLDTYDKYPGFSILDKQDSRLRYTCKQCNSIIERTMSHYCSSEYLVCEYCYPKRNFGARIYTDLGYFDSKIEYEAYKILLRYLDPSLIIRQKKYDEIFNTGTNHTADFYIPTLDLILEVTSKYNKIGKKYKDTAIWKKSLSEKVVWAYSLSEVEDIVRSRMKVLELTVGYWRDVLCFRIVW